MELSFKNILVVGLGLIGGSILKTIKELNIPLEVYGLDLHEEVTKDANKIGLINNFDNQLKKIEEDCLIIFSVPSLSFERAFKLIEGSFDDEKVIFTDTFSSKSKLLEFLEGNADIGEKFVMSHPIAGSEKSGLMNSLPFLFKDKLVLVSHLNSSSENNNVIKVKSFWEQLGSKVSIMDPVEHDKVLSKTSHLPHVISFALMHFLEKELGEKVFKYSGGSLESYTRIASSDPLMWKDVTVSNKEAVLEAIKGFKSSLNEVSKLIDSEDEESILDFLSFVKEVRDKQLFSDGTSWKASEEDS
ncbi:MAG TPA: prephenate dehydrogenase [Gammaproteobacteria bacterium]|jgi:prephenate dehydrogenase|nr:prephenate dehydrogenase [Gammaproteobacteria bacterium]